MLPSNETKLEVLNYDDAGKIFTVKSSASGHSLQIQDTFAEMFPLWVGRILITAENEKWVQVAANVTTGFATSVIMAPAEAAVERMVPADQTPDKRPGALVQIYNRDRFSLKHQLMEGSFIVEDGFGAQEGVAGGNFMIFAENQQAGLKAAEAAVDAIRARAPDVIMPFPGRVCRSGP